MELSWSCSLTSSSSLLFPALFSKPPLLLSNNNTTLRFPNSSNTKKRRKKKKPSITISSSSSSNNNKPFFSLSDGNKTNSYNKNKWKKKPLSDDDARRIIHAKAQYLSRLRRNQGPQAQPTTPRWIRRTPDQMLRYINDDRDAHRHPNHVIAAIKTLRSLSQRSPSDYDIRQVMAGFVARLTFREMCVVLNHLRSWRLVTDFFAWMKLQLCYTPSVVAYTILLRTYAHVGKIRLAEETFLEMLVVGIQPDEIACGTLLCAYARWGRHDDMLTFHDAVRRKDIVPPIAVYNFMLSSLQKKRMHAKVIELWTNHIMLPSHQPPNRFTYTVVISSYVKNNQLDEALKLFTNMRRNSNFVPEEATYSILVGAAVKQGKWDQARRLYDDMKLQSIIPSNYTCASLLTLYYKSGDYSKALSLFSDMERKKIAPDEVIYGIVVRIYGKLGLYEDAISTFEDAERLGLLKDEKTYVAMAQVHLNCGRHDRALETFALLKSRNLNLSTFSYCALLRCHAVREDVDSAEIVVQALSRSSKLDAVSCNIMLILYIKLDLLERAVALLSRLREDKVQFNEDLYRTVVQVYCKSGMLSDAENLLQEMDSAGFRLDRFTKTSLMAMYVQHGGIQKAEYLFESLEKPDATALSVMLRLYIEDENADQTQKVLKSLLQTTDGLSLASQLINKFAKEGDATKAEFLYDQVSRLGFIPDDGAVASIITLYGQQRHSQKAEYVFEAVSRSHKIGRLVYTSMVSAHIKCGKVDEASILYNRMVVYGLTLDVVTLSVLVNALTKYGRYSEAENIILNTLQGDVMLDTVAYNTYIKAMLEAGKLQYASSIFNQMISSGASPSIQTYNTMISVYGRGGKLDKAVEMFNAAQNLGVPVDEKAYTNMINCYGKAGRSSEAFRLFSKMQEEGIKPGKVSYNVMIDAYANAGLLHEADNLLESMQKDGHSPDSVTFLALIQGYTKSGKYSQAEEIIHKMLKNGISPSCAHFNHLIFAYTNMGSTHDVERIYGDMKQLGLSPDLGCCRSMMRAYVDHGHVQKGILFFEEINGLLKLDGYILSAAVHLYESAGNISTVENILDFMDKNGLVFIRSLKIGWKS